MKRLHSVFFRSGQMVDILPARADFLGYKLVVVPHMIITDPDFVQRLSDYVRGGGVAMVTYRTAIKDRDNNLTFGKVIPVDMTELLGLYVEETESVQEYDCIPLVGEGKATAGIFRDMIVPETAQVPPALRRSLLPDLRPRDGQRLRRRQRLLPGHHPRRRRAGPNPVSGHGQAGLQRMVLPEGRGDRGPQQQINRAVRLVINHNAHSTEAFEVAVLPEEQPQA